MKASVLFFFIFIWTVFGLNAQSPNVDVGESEFAAPSCWAAAQNDLWFTFIASAKSINIVANASEGTMDNPEIALYLGGDCNSLSEIGCITDESTVEIVTLFESNLVVGERYFIRIDGRTNGNDGTFQLCISSFNPPIEPGQDCSTASLLCNKDPFVVQSILGAGADENEADGSCLDVGGSSENNSTWFKWTCSVSGTFTMDLRPLIITDDYDFAIFELPNGIDDCEKNIIRCNATDGGGLEPCGPDTGLDLTSTDIEEDENCDAGEDGYLRFIDMVAGQSYALLINNFSDSDAGFSLEFGGDAEFEGPTADFDVEFLTCGNTIEVTNSSVTGVSEIETFEWEFGIDAVPSSGTGPGPFTVEYGSFGSKNITLQLVSELGCQVTLNKEIIVEACTYLDSLEIVLDSINNIGCGGAGSGYIGVLPSIACGTYEYNIDGGAFQTEPIFENLAEGQHLIGIRDENMCAKDTSFTITQVADFTVDAGLDVTISDINTGIVLDASSTAMGDVTISWSPGSGISCTDGTTNCYNPTVIITQEETYVISVTDENGCVATDEIVVSVDLCGASDFTLEPPNDITLDFPGDTINPRVGTEGSNDITVSWTPAEPVICTSGTTNCLNPILVVLETTTFTITIIDEFGCERTDMLTVVVPDVCINSDLTIQIDSLRGDYCNGALGSFVQVSGSGGNPGYEFNIDDGEFSDVNNFADLAPGQYKIDIKDGFNCEQSITVTIEEILGFEVDAGEDITIDGSEPFEMLNGSHEANGPVIISWSPEIGIVCVDSTTNCLNPAVNPASSITYTLTVADGNGCTASDQLTVIVEERTGIFPPTIFSPNEDGFNDFFSILGDPNIVDVIEQLNIYDRWGNLVYSGRGLSPFDPNSGWDGKISGKKAETGVYTWFAEVRLINNLAGQTEEVKTVKGDITLIR